MMSRRNSDVIPRYNDYDEDRPDDERLSLSYFTEDGSQRTYVQKKAVVNPGSSVSKRSAFKAPSEEPDRKTSHLQSFANLPLSSDSSRPPLDDWKQSYSPATKGQEHGSPELLLGFSQNNLDMHPTSGTLSTDLSSLQAFTQGVQRHQRQPPISKPPRGFNGATSASSHASTGRFDDATHDLHEQGRR